MISRITERLQRLGLAGLFGLGLFLMSPDPSPGTQETGTVDEVEISSPQTGDSAKRAPAIDIPNARYPAPGLLVGGQPSREHLAEAAEAGYRAIVNLRSQRETAGGDEAAEAEKLGLHYFAIPISGSDDLTGENADLLAQVLADEANLPVMIHCASGNRVGALLALKAAYSDGKVADEALAIGLEAGLTSLEAKVRRILGLFVEVEE